MSRIHWIVCAGCLTKWAALAIFFAAAVPSWGQETLPPGKLAAGPESQDFEQLSRGPVHEAFALAVSHEPIVYPMVAQQPPASIDEEPAVLEADDEFQADAVWIPGYWSWDEEKDTFIWISGVWRVPPAERTWVAGQWQDVAGGWQWTSGYWAIAEQPHEARFLDAPPPTLEAGPSGPAPSTEHFWIPGNWVWRVDAYRWQPGRWCAYREDLVWVPAHYVWTPQGCIFVDGYWDYPFGSRGQLYAPVQFFSPVAYYRPVCRLPLRSVYLHLFINTGRPCYFFGDYYDSWYRDRRCFPIHQYRLANRWYDPFFAYDRVYFARRGINGLLRRNAWHNFYARNVNVRPSRLASGPVAFASDRVVRSTVLPADPAPQFTRRIESQVTRLQRSDAFRAQGNSIRQNLATPADSTTVGPVQNAQRDSLTTVTRDLRRANRERITSQDEKRVSSSTNTAVGQTTNESLGRARQALVRREPQEGNAERVNRRVESLTPVPRNIRSEGATNGNNGTTTATPRVRERRIEQPSVPDATNRNGQTERIRNTTLQQTRGSRGNIVRQERSVGTPPVPRSVPMATGTRRDTSQMSTRRIQVEQPTNPTTNSGGRASIMRPSPSPTRRVESFSQPSNARRAAPDSSRSRELRSGQATRFQGSPNVQRSRNTNSGSFQSSRGQNSGRVSPSRSQMSPSRAAPTSRGGNGGESRRGRGRG